VASLSEIPIDESTPCRPDTPYGASKLAAEVAVQRELSCAACDWCVLRPPLMYGQGNPGNMERLLALVYLGLPLPLGSIRNRRSFLYVGNFVNAVERALSHPSASNRLFCIGDSEDLSTPTLIRGLGYAANRPVRLFPFPISGLRLLGRMGSFFEGITGKSMKMDSASVAKLCGSLCINGSRFRTECEWRPPYSLQEALRLTVGATTL
jgi:nucleoside-diphosphate-sugar epimerase